jgi:hypothetical protein
VFLPGSVLPADLAYGALIAELDDALNAVVKELEVYAGDTPPPDYSLTPRSTAFCAR